MYIQYRSDARYKACVIYTLLHEEVNALVHWGKYMFIYSLYKETNMFTRHLPYTLHLICTVYSYNVCTYTCIYVPSLFLQWPQSWWTETQWNTFCWCLWCTTFSPSSQSENKTVIVNNHLYTCTCIQNTIMYKSHSSLVAAIYTMYVHT